MARYTADNVHVLSVEAVDLPKRGKCLKVRLAFIMPNGLEGDEIMLETTRIVHRSQHDEAEAIRVARHWFLRLCELGVEAMEPFRISDEQMAEITKA